MFLDSSHQVFQEKKRMIKNVLENFLGQIKRLKHLPKKHQVSMNTIQIILHYEVVEPFLINMIIKTIFLIRKKRRHMI